MGSLVFVHGIGSRAATDGGEHPYDATCRAIGWELFFKKIEWKLVKCQWGDELGARLRADGKSFPPYEGKLAVAGEPDDAAGVWRILLDDPSFELRALATMLKSGAAAQGVAPVPPGPPGATIPPSVALQARLAAGITPAGPLLEQLKRFELEGCFGRAVDAVKADPETQGAVPHPQAFRAIARAIVARTVRCGVDLGIPPPGGADLELMVQNLEPLLREGQLFGIPDWAKKALAGWLTSKGERQRAVLLSAASPLAGDVIVYGVHGNRIRDRIREVVAHAPEPVAILAHSLGGIAAAETLAEDPATRERVKRFITVGSQSGFFYEIDALCTLPFGTRLPSDFPDWLNFWDPRDFLSFVVDGVFTGGGTRTDVRADSGLPFPASHSGYWRQSIVWERVKDFLKGI
jgi:hypothetical protein